MQIPGVEAGVQNMDFGCWGVGCGSRVLGCRMQIPGAGVQDMDRWGVGCGSWVLGLGCRTWTLSAK